MAYHSRFHLTRPGYQTVTVCGLPINGNTPLAQGHKTASCGTCRNRYVQQYQAHIRRQGYQEVA